MSGLTSGAPEPGIRTYNSQVRVGNWNEDICLEEDLLKGMSKSGFRGQEEQFLDGSRHRDPWFPGGDDLR